MNGQLKLVINTARQTPEAPTHELGMARILSVYEESNPAEYTRGMRWYPDANNIAHSLVKLSGAKVLSSDHGAGVIAALSPNESWPQNVRRAKQLARTGHTTGPRAFVDVATRIFNGESADEVLFEPHRNNFKVRHFYRNIGNPACAEAVTVDRHARSMISHAPSGAFGKSLNEQEYESIAAMFQEAATIEKILPNQMQAITWLAWRRMCGTMFAAELGGVVTPSLFEADVD